MRAVFLTLVLLCQATLAQTASPQLADDVDYAMLAYYGRMTSRVLNKVIRFDIAFTQGNLYSFELSRPIARDNLMQKIFDYTGSRVHIAGNVTFQDDPVGSIVELNPYFLFRWHHFPWNSWLITTLGIGEGISWASSHPARETRDTTKAENARKLLNFLSIEATFALPKYPDWELVYRIHHRSGVFGLYSPGIVGSTAVGVGIRHNFF